MKFKNQKVLSLLSVALILSACGPLGNKHVKCNDESALTLVQQVLHDDLSQALDKELKDLIKNNAIRDLDPNKLKLSVNQIKFNLNDTRTDFIDPNSPKTTCSVDLETLIPADLVKKSEEARKKAGVVSVVDEANNLGLNFSNNKVQMTLEYILQPTDKGDKVLAVVKNTKEMHQLLSDTLTYAFLKPQIEKNIIKNNQIRSQEAVVDASEEATAAAEDVALDTNSTYEQDSQAGTENSY